MAGLFDPRKKGSFYTLGCEKSKAHIILLHGSGQNAEKIKPAAEKLANLLPSQHIIVPNGYVDNCDLGVPSYRRAQEEGQRYDWQFWTQNQVNQFEKNNFEDSPFSKIQEQFSQNSQYHLVGFSAGAHGALIEFASAPELYKSLTLIGYHIDKDLAQHLVNQSKINPSILQKPIFCGFGLADPIYAFNRNSLASRVIGNLPFNLLAQWGNRYHQQQSHKENIKTLRNAGFRVEEKTFTRSAHTLSHEALNGIAQFIKETHKPERTYEAH